MPDSLRGSKPGWGKRLLEALTRDQIETLLDVLADTGALSRLPEELRAVDSDLADTVQRLVGKADISAMNSPDEAVSNRKSLETWYELWGRWNSHVCEGKASCRKARHRRPEVRIQRQGNNYRAVQ